MKTQKQNMDFSMDFTKISFYICLFFLCIVTILISCDNSSIDEENINIGNKYLYSHLYDIDDPFAIKDTLIVLDIKNEYVQFQYQSSQNISSMKLKHFKYLVTELPK